MKLGLKPMWLVSTCNLWWLPVTLKCLIILGFLTLTFNIFHASAKCHKESMLVALWQNQRNGMCAQRRLRSAWESTQSDQSSLSTWRKLGSLATYWAHNEDSDQTGQMPRLIWRLIWVFAGHTCYKAGCGSDCVSSWSLLIFLLWWYWVIFSHKNIDSIYKEDSFQVKWSYSRKNLFMRLCYSIRFKISCSAGDSVWVLKVWIQQVSVAAFNWPYKKGTMQTCHIFSPLKYHRNF